MEQGYHTKNSIFVWAGGNGKGVHDNGNYDGYANHYTTMAIGAVDHTGHQAWYSEDCACLLAVTPSSGTSGKSITTVDLSGAPGYGPVNALINLVEHQVQRRWLPGSLH